MRETRVVWSGLLILTVAVLNPSLCLRFDPKDEIDSIVCPTTTTYRGKILDIHRSMDLGAELIEGTWQVSLESCVSHCCMNDKCDMALYKNEGVSQSGKNCYFVHCGKPEHCVIVDHAGFTSVSLDSTDVAKEIDKQVSTTKAPRVDTGDAESDSDSTSDSKSDADRSDMQPSPSTDSKEVSTTTASPPSSQAPSPTTTKITKTDAQPTKQSSVSNTSSPQTNSTLKTNSSNKSTPAEGKISDQNVAKADKALSPSQNKGNTPSDSKDCGKYGCDGSGLIAVAVVGSICFAIVVLVVAVLLKRVVDDKRKKRFNNVDYLINGMYT